jgi:hypothetical protein
VKAGRRTDEDDPPPAALGHALGHGARHRAGGDEVHDAQSVDERGILDGGAGPSRVAQAGAEQCQPDGAVLIVRANRRDGRIDIHQVQRPDRDLGTGFTAHSRDVFESVAIASPQN